MFSTLIILACAASIDADVQADTLQPSTVVADRGVVVSRTDTIAVGNSFSITGVLSQSPGLLMSDYGWCSGLKTVSLRGMGSSHTAIYVDGVRFNDVQSGQYDLGVLGLENCVRVVIDYAQNSISLITSRPEFGEGPVSGRVGFAGGSFGTVLPSGRINFRLGENLSLSAFAAGNISRGDYPCGDGKVRENNDIAQVKAGLDLFGTLAGGDWNAKVFFNGSDRGTPGSIFWPSSDRQTNRDLFVQGLMRKSFGIYSLNLSAKAAYDYIFYKSLYGDSDYAQREIQVNSSHRVRVAQWLDLSAAADLQLDGLTATGAYAYDQLRFTLAGALASVIKAGPVKADLALEYVGAFDRGQSGRSALSPSFDISVILGDGWGISGFARRAYRIPTFNDLYYPGFGKPGLKPEDALMTDLGVDWSGKISEKFALRAKVDAFFNLLTDKITSAPTAEDPNIWAPFNIGRVRSAGFDAVAGLNWSSRMFKADASLRYSFQDAVDKTPSSDSYGRQIAYVARHSVVATASASFRGFALEAVAGFRGGRSDAQGALSNYTTVDITLSKAFCVNRAGTLALKVSGRNLTGCRYELSTGYPMPGRSIMGGIEYGF